MKGRLTYANVMVTVLAFIVLGGGAYAATKLPKNSVGTKQIKNNAVTAAKIQGGAVDASKLSASALSDYAKTGDLGGYAKTGALSGLAAKSELGSYAKLPVGPDQQGTIPAATLGSPIHNVGPGGVTCHGTNSKLPNEAFADVAFSAVQFDDARLVHTETGAVPKCFTGFEVQRTGVYAVSAWLGWEFEPKGTRELTIADYSAPATGIFLAKAEQAANSDAGGSVAQTASAVARLERGHVISIQGYQDSGEALNFAGGSLSIAWLGN